MSDAAPTVGPLGRRLRRRWDALAREPEDQRSVAPVFVLTLAVMGTMPFLASTQWGRGLSTLLVGMSAVVALVRTGAHTAIRRTATGIVVATAVVGGAGPALVGEGEVRSMEILGAALFALLLLITPLVVMFRLLIRPKVTLDTVAGALAAYLQIGLFFGAVFRLVDLVDSQPFFKQTDDPTPFDFTYFSFTTITTTGYGDLTPTQPVGQSLANLEAILGQAFLVTVVALVVGNLGREIPHRLRPPAAAPDAADDGPPQVGDRSGAHADPPSPGPPPG